MQSSPQQNINSSPMSRFQIQTVAICVMINMLDGFDVLVVAFTAPEIARQWGVEPSALGVLLSAGLVGMASGSLFLAPLADRYGRRALILTSLVIVSLGMLLSAATQSVVQLAILRVITGLGIGALLASLNTLVAEYASDRRRDLAVAVLQSGYPLGATVGGLISIVIVSQFGWRAVFLFSGLLSSLMIPVVMRQLPESLAYLASRRPPRALQRINGILARLELAPLAAMPPPESGLAGQELASGRRERWQTLRSLAGLHSLLLCSAFFLLMLSFYFVMSWTPKLLVDSGLTANTGRSAGVILNLAGILGCCVMGYLAGRTGIKRMSMLYLGGGALCMALFGVVDQQSLLMPLLGFVMGYFIFGAMTSLYAIAPRLYAPSIRTTGTGFAIGVGRFGAIVGPFLAGLLLARDIDPGTCYIIFAVPVLLALGAIALLRLKQSL